MKIAILTDFDGTLTAVPGGKLVFTKFYQSLQKNPLDSYTSELFERNILIEKMTNEFGLSTDALKERDPRRITQKAIDFLKKMLLTNDVNIIIITKNQTDYIQAMLAYEGFSDEQINAIEIDDTGDKKQAAKDFLADKKMQSVFIFDDSSDDEAEMKKGAKKYCNDVISCNQKPGEFKWDDYTQQIKQKQSPVSIASSPLSLHAPKPLMDRKEIEDKHELDNTYIPSSP